MLMETRQNPHLLDADAGAALLGRRYVRYSVIYVQGLSVVRIREKYLLVPGAGRNWTTACLRIHGIEIEPIVVSEEARHIHLLRAQFPCDSGYFVTVRVLRPPSCLSRVLIDHHCLRNPA